VTIGIRPVRPDTAYGYLETDEGSARKDSTGKYSIYNVAKFHEKPTADKAAQFIANGNSYWNSGMFFWRFSTFQKEFGQANPIMAETLEDMTDAIMANDEKRAKAIFDAMPSISIDYALMEKSGRISVIPGNFIWDDLGSWDTLEQTFPADGSGNVTYGDPVLIDCSSTVVYNAPGGKKMAVAAVGLKDMVVVVNDDAVLIVPKDRAQDVRKVVVTLRERGASQI
jgi:mannose-1-phosphate guanylyltransferase